MPVSNNPISIGTDPEVFITNNNQVVSAIGLIGGTKKKPYLVNEGGLQEDNVLAEFNIDPCFNEDEFSDRIDKVLHQLEERIGENYSTLIKPSHIFDESIFLDEKALSFGCNPDINCWSKKANKAPNGAKTTLRTAGGHVHIGYDSPKPLISFKIAQSCDIYLGIPSVLLDKDVRRRELYGKAGACRIKRYGVEYRTLSNFWLKNDQLKKWVFRNSVKACKNYNIVDDILQNYSVSDIQNIINNSEEEEAKKIILSYNLEVPNCA